MTELSNTTPEARLYAAAEDTFASEGGRFTPPFSRAVQQQMDDLSIRYSGSQYDYKGYRYDRLSDAVAYANIDRARSPRGDDAATETATTPPSSRSRAEQLADVLRRGVAATTGNVRKQVAGWVGHAGHNWFRRDKT